MRRLNSTGRRSCHFRFFDEPAWCLRARHGAGLLALVLGGCLGGRGAEPAGPSPASAVASDSGPGLQVPGTFSHGGSCGGAWGDEVFLTLLPDGVFSLRQTYRDGGCVPQLTLLYIGRWDMAEDGREVRLDNGPIWLRVLTIVDRRTLRIPDPPDATPPRSPVYRTAYPARLVPFGDPFRLQGVVIPAAHSQ